LAESAPFTIETFVASDGYRWRYRRYQAGMSSVDLSARARVVCLHGIQSHGGWYEYSCSRLARAGFQVSFLDRRGSGINERDRGDVSSFVRLLEDLAEFLNALRTGFFDGVSSLPVFLLGISWGAKLTVALQRYAPVPIHGQILLCPGFLPRVKPPLSERLRIAWSRLVAPHARYPIPLNDPELFTTTESWQRFLRDDPLSLHDATARFLVESFRLDRYIRPIVQEIQEPILLFLGGE